MLMTSPSDLPNQPKYSDDSLQKIDNLFQSFEMIADLAEEEIRQQKIREAAAKFDLSEVAYQKQFKRYLGTKAYQAKNKSLVPSQEVPTASVTPLLKPFSFLDTKVSDFVDSFKQVSLVKLSAVLGESALLFAMISYIITIPSRHQLQVQKAREILLQSTERKYDQSRIAALQVLDKRCAGNPGLVSPKAHLANLVLVGCSRWSFSLQSFTQLSFRFWQPMDLSYSRLAEADLSNARLTGANLEGSDLRKANLQKVDLRGVNLQGANLAGADLSRANLAGANLEDAILDGANLYGVTASQANFTQASFVNAKAPWSYFDQANFYRANLKQANFNRSDLENADFYKVNLKDATLRFSNLRGTH